jgi:hypothetical protein
MLRQQRFTFPNQSRYLQCPSFQISACPTNFPHKNPKYVLNSSNTTHKYFFFSPGFDRKYRIETSTVWFDDFSQKHLQFKQTICLWTSHKMGYLNFDVLFCWTSHRVLSEVLSSRADMGKKECPHFTEKEFQLWQPFVQQVTWKKNCLRYWDGEHWKRLRNRCHIVGRHLLAHATIDAKQTDRMPYRRRTCTGPEGGN